MRYVCSIQISYRDVRYTGMEKQLVFRKFNVSLGRVDDPLGALFKRGFKLYSVLVRNMLIQFPSQRHCSLAE